MPVCIFARSSAAALKNGRGLNWLVGDCAALKNSTGKKGIFSGMSPCRIHAQPYQHIFYKFRSILILQPEYIQGQFAER